MEIEGLINNLHSLSLTLLNVTNAEYKPSSWKIEPTSFDYNNIYYFYSGECDFIIDGNEIHAKKGDLVLIPQSHEFSYFTNSLNSISLYSCAFNAKITEYFLFDVLKTNFIISIPDSDRAKALFQCLCQPTEGTRFENTILQLNKHKALCELITFYISFSNPIWSENFEKRSQGMSTIIDYIKKHLAENLTNEILAKIVSLHPNYFIKSFQILYFQTPMRYVSSLRLEKAKSLVTETNFSLKEIAVETGLGSASNLIKKYKTFYGVTPNSHRDKNN